MNNPRTGLIVIVLVLVGIIGFSVYQKKFAGCNDPNCKDHGPQFPGELKNPNTPPEVTPPVAPPDFKGKIFKYSEALPVSKQTHVQMLVVFGAEKRCVWCKKLEQTLKSPELQNDLARYINVRVDVDQEKDVAAKLGAAGKGIPCYAIVDENERVVKTGSGYKNASGFQKWLAGSQSEAWE
jgi:thioredoxin family protein